MNIGIITPAPAGSRKGNRITALRWARLLRDSGHRVSVQQVYHDRRFEPLIALHARRSFPSIDRFSRLHPDRPLIVVLTGTDLYADIHTSERAVRSLQLATRLVVLHARAIHALPKVYRDKARTIVQSVQPLRPKPAPKGSLFEVCVIGHLRPVKDPFRAAMAARRLPHDSRIHIIHTGQALSKAMARRATAETKNNPRYRWVGDKPRYRARRILARSRLMVISSKMEGGSNTLAEAIVDQVPVLASRIDGNLGLLGADYPGYFPVGDTAALAALMLRAERDRTFYRRLQQECRRLAPQFGPALERRRLNELVTSLR